jgi:magnesium-transporting ATPase (P-type)
VEEFLLALALCHSAFVEPSASQGHEEDHHPVYQASSPDDEALVLAAAEHGVTLTSVRRSPTTACSKLAIGRLTM